MVRTRWPVLLLVGVAEALGAATERQSQGPCQGPCPVSHLECGGNYGRSFRNQGVACPPPTWEVAWALNRSTIPGPYSAFSPSILCLFTHNPEDCASNGLLSPANMSRWGSVTFDWSDGADLWQNTLPGHTGEAVVAEQCRRVKAEGTGTRCMVYRNTELALQWEETSRAAMTQQNVDNNWFLKFKSRAVCDAAAPCSAAAFHSDSNPNLPPVPCNKTAPPAAPNCAYCCNFTAGGSTGAYNEPIGGLGNGSSRFGSNALGDGQFFWDYRTVAAQDYWAKEVCLKGVSSDHVDGTFTDDPAGYGQEHPVVQSATQLTAAEIAALQIGTQKAWMKALALLIPAKKYIPQAYRVPPPFDTADPANCTGWMRTMCAVPANESTLVFQGVPGWLTPTGTLAASNMSVAAFLVARGPHSYIEAPMETINRGDPADPFFRLYRLDTGRPTGMCVEPSHGVFTREWSGGRASVDCMAATAKLDFGLLPVQ